MTEDSRAMKFLKQRVAEHRAAGLPGIPYTLYGIIAKLMEDFAAQELSEDAAALQRAERFAPRREALDRLCERAARQPEPPEYEINVGGTTTNTNAESGLVFDPLRDGY